MIEQYRTDFENACYALLGGLEMGDDFFANHPDIKAKLPTEAAYHFKKGGLAAEGAACWFRFVARPRIKDDRALAKF